jgi:hypothetical protein
MLQNSSSPAARAALAAVPGTKDRVDHSDASPEWIAARDRAEAKARAAALEVVRGPLTVQSLVTLAAAAEWDRVPQGQQWHNLFATSPATPPDMSSGLALDPGVFVSR